MLGKIEVKIWKADQRGAISSMSTFFSCIAQLVHSAALHRPIGPSGLSRRAGGPACCPSKTCGPRGGNQPSIFSPCASLYKLGVDHLNSRGGTTNFALHQPVQNNSAN